MSLQEEAEASMIKESVYIDDAKKEAGAWLAFIDDPERRLTKNRNIVERD